MNAADMTVAQCQDLRAELSASLAAFSYYYRIAPTPYAADEGLELDFAQSLAYGEGITIQTALEIIVKGRLTP